MLFGGIQVTSTAEGSGIQHVLPCLEPNTVNEVSY